MSNAEFTFELELNSLWRNREYELSSSQRKLQHGNCGISYLISHHCDKNPDKGNFRKEGLLWLSV